MTATDILTGLLVIITAWYAWLTRQMVKATERSVRVLVDQSLAASRPYLEIAPIVQAHTIFQLRIRNVGRTAAQNVRLAIDKDYFAFGDRNRPSIRSYSAFRESIASFAPSEELQFYLAQSFVVFGEEADDAVTPSVFTVTAEYGFQNQRVSESHLIDLRPYLNSVAAKAPLAEELEQICAALGRSADALGRMQSGLERVGSRLQTPEQPTGPVRQDDVKASPTFEPTPDEAGAA